MPGRLRIRVPSKRGDADYFRAVKEALSAVEGVESVEVAPLTGSVLLCSQAAAQKLIEAARAQGLFVVKEEPEVEGTVLHDSIAAGFASMNDRVKTLSGAGFDLPGLAFLALMGAGIYQIARGNFAAPAWYTAFWYALGIFSKSAGKSDHKTEKGLTE
jgi:copper chaperone CopZ